MTFKNWHSYRRLLALFLTLGLLVGCARSSSSPGKDSLPDTTTVSQDYEIYKKDSLDAQKAFNELCTGIFKSRVIESSLSLHYTLADPAAYGITDYPITYGDFSLKSMQDDIQKFKEEQAILNTIDVNQLTDEQQLTYRILAESYRTELLSDGLELYYQPLAPTIGVQAQYPILLAEYPFYNKQDIDDYLGLLSQTDQFYADILKFEQEKSAAGLFMTDDCLEEILASCEAYLLTPERSFLSETFTERLGTVSGLTEEEITDYTAKNLEILETNFIPAYQLLSDGLKELKGTGLNEQGMCYYPEGKKYYEYLIKSSTATTYDTIDDLRDAIQDQMDLDLIAMSNIMDEHPDVTSLLTTYEIPEHAPQQLIESLMTQIAPDFPAFPQCSYTIKYVPEALEGTLSPAFYLVPPIDRYQNNTIYINQSSSSAEDLFSLLAHEGYPGHLFQTVYFADKCTDNLRLILNFSSYSEGWALYVENYSYTLDNGLDPNLSQLLARNSSCSMGLHAILDLYINYYGWTKEQVHDYLSKYYDLDGNDIVDSLYSTLIANPTNYLEYYVGYLEILQMRNMAEKTLGDQFDLKAFHTFILDMGPAPFTVMEPYFKTWLLTYEL